MKKIVAMLLALLLCLSACAWAEPVTLTVAGNGVVSVMPDTAVITLGVRESSKDVGKAQSAVNEKLTAVIERLRDMGIAQDKISTNAISIYEDYSYGSDSENQRYYAAENTIDVEIADIENAGKYIDAVFEAGANTFGNIMFKASNTDEEKKRALELSVENARRKADVLAAAAGMRITGILAINEQGADFFGNYYYANSYDAMYAKAEEAAGTGTPVMSQMIQVSATVNVVYAMEPVE